MSKTTKQKKEKKFKKIKLNKKNKPRKKLLKTRIAAGFLVVVLCVSGFIMFGMGAGAVPPPPPDIGKETPQVEIMLDAAGGTGSPEKISVKIDDYFLAPTADSAEIEKYCYDLVGWSLTKNSSIIDFTPGQQIIIKKLAEQGVDIYNIKLYAVWKSSLYAMFSTDTGEGEKLDPISIEIDKESQLPVYEGTREGYDFAGWSTRPNGLGLKYKYDAKTKKFSPRFYGGDKSVVLYPIWEGQQRTLTIDLSHTKLYNNGEQVSYSYVSLAGVNINGSGNTVSGKYGQIVTVPDVDFVLKAGEGDGYYTHFEDENGVRYNPGDKVLLTENKILTPVKFTYITGKSMFEQTVVAFSGDNRVYPSSYTPLAAGLPGAKDPEKFVFLNGFSLQPNQTDVQYAVGRGQEASNRTSGGRLFFEVWAPKTAKIKYDNTSVRMVLNLTEQLEAGKGINYFVINDNYVASGSNNFKIGEFYPVPLFSDLTDENGNEFTFFSTKPDGKGEIYIPGDWMQIKDEVVTLYPNFTFDPNQFKLTAMSNKVDYASAKDPAFAMPEIEYYVTPSDLIVDAVIRFDGQKIYEGAVSNIHYGGNNSEANAAAAVAGMFDMPRTPGMYTISLTANFGGIEKTAQISYEIFINDALEAYFYAAQYFKTATYSTVKEGSATPSMGGNQSIWGLRKKDQYGSFYELSTNYGDSIMGVDPKIAFDAFRNPSENSYGWRKVTGGKVKNKTNPDFSGTGWNNVSNEQGITNVIGTNNADLLYYIITSYSDFKNAPELKKSGTGYEVHFDMHTDRVGGNYRKNVEYMAQKSFSSFGWLKVTLTFDSKYRVVKIHNDEQYSISITISTVKSDVKLWEVITYGFEGKLTRDNCGTLKG